MGRSAVVFAGLIALAACGPPSRPLTRAAVTTTVALGTTTTMPRTTTTRPPPGPVAVHYRIDVRTTDAETAGFADAVVATLADGRGWSRAGFVITRRDDAPFTVVIAEAAEVDRLCRPYDTFGKYSCQNGPVVAINADRWRHGTPEWTGDLGSYRQMIVNHEFGHLLGLGHRTCPSRGQPAPVMSQESTNLDGCAPNPWPLADEIARLSPHDLPMAPPYGVTPKR